MDFGNNKEMFGRDLESLRAENAALKEQLTCMMQEGEVVAWEFDTQSHFGIWLGNLQYTEPTRGVGYKNKRPHLHPPAQCRANRAEDGGGCYAANLC